MKKYEYKDKDEDEFVPTKRFLQDWHKEDPRQQNPFLYEPHKTDIRRIKGVLTNFRSLWAEKIVPADWMMDFMADGAGKYCANGVPWPTNAKRSLCPRVVGMVQVIYERFGMSHGLSDQKLRSEIAAELEEGMEIGYLNSALLFGGLIALTAVVHFAFRLNGVLTFWIAYVLTRPLGASVGDLLSQSVKHDGLGYGVTTVSEVFFVLILLLVGYLTMERRTA